MPHTVSTTMTSEINSGLQYKLPAASTCLKYPDGCPPSRCYLPASCSTEGKSCMVTPDWNTRPGHYLSASCSGVPSPTNDTASSSVHEKMSHSCMRHFRSASLGRTAVQQYGSIDNRPPPARVADLRARRGIENRYRMNQGAKVHYHNDSGYMPALLRCNSRQQSCAKVHACTPLSPPPSLPS